MPQQRIVVTIALLTWVLTNLLQCTALDGGSRYFQGRGAVKLHEHPTGTNEVF